MACITNAKFVACCNIQDGYVTIPPVKYGTTINRVLYMANHCTWICTLRVPDGSLLAHIVSCSNLFASYTILKEVLCTYMSMLAATLLCTRVQLIPTRTSYRTCTCTCTVVCSVHTRMHAYANYKSHVKHSHVTENTYM